jgi:hypothetical protein
MSSFTENFFKFAEALPENLQPGKVEARALLKEATTATATGLLIAIRALHGDDVLTWEPETLWLTLERDGIPTDNVERDKIQAARSLVVRPSFYWDNLVFQRTVQALNGQPFSAESIQEANTAHMCWAVYEASVLRNLDPDEKKIPEFDEDVQQYVAVCLRREGFVLPPDVLSFAEDNLEKMLPKDAADLKKEVKQAWGHLNKSKLAHTEFAENEHGVQLARLAACYLFQQECAEHLANEVIRLGVKPT